MKYRMKNYFIYLEFIIVWCIICLTNSFCETNCETNPSYGNQTASCACGNKTESSPFAFSKIPVELYSLYDNAQKAPSKDSARIFYMQAVDTITKKLDSLKQREPSEDIRNKILEYEFFLIATKVNIAACYLFSDKPTEAITAYEECTTLVIDKINNYVGTDLPFFRTYITILHLRCLALLKEGKKDKAISEMKKGLEETKILSQKLLGSSDDNILIAQAKEGKLKVSEHTINDIARVKNMMGKSIENVDKIVDYLKQQKSK